MTLRKLYPTAMFGLSIAGMAIAITKRDFGTWSWAFNTFALSGFILAGTYSNDKEGK